MSKIGRWLDARAGETGAARGHRIKRRAQAALAVALWLLVIAITTASFFFRLENRNVMVLVSGAERLRELLYWSTLLPLAAPAYATVGVIVAALRPRNPVGWLSLSLGLLIGAQDMSWQYAARALEISPGSLPAGRIVALVSAVAMQITVPPAPFTLMLLRFPDGRCLGKGWNKAAWMVGVGALLGIAGVLLHPTVSAGLRTELPSPTGVAGLHTLAEILIRAGWVLGTAALVIAVLSQIVRWRNSQGDERQQLAWLAFMGAVMLTALMITALMELVAGETYPSVLVGGVGLAAACFGIPAAIGFAILKRRLYDINTLIHRTLVYSMLTSALLVLYLGSILLLQAVFLAATGQRSDMAVILSTLGIAALFNPLRLLVQRFIDRRFYRRRYDAIRVLESFGETARSEVDLNRLVDRLLVVVNETVQPEVAGLWLVPRPEPGSLLDAESRDI